MSMVNKSYSSAIEKIDKKISDACKKAGHSKVLVVYNAYEFDEFDIPIDDLDTVPIKGKITVIDEGNFWSGVYEDYAKKYMLRCVVPWAHMVVELAVAANEMILTTNDTHHKYFEDIRFDDDGNVILSMGS